MVATAILTFNACVPEDEEGGRFPDLQDAANMRIIVDQNFSSINADDPSSAQVVFDIYSENIDDVEKVELFADFFDFSEGTTNDRVFLKTVPISDFSTGVLENFTITFDEFKTALGLQDSDFDGLDQVTIYNETTLKDGRVYPQTFAANDEVNITNTTPNILNSAATTSFTATVTVFVQCPLTDGFATGKYMLEQISGPTDPFFGNPYRWGPTEVTINADGPIQRSFTGKYLTFDVGFNFVVTCGTLVVPKGSSGLSCGGPSLDWIQDGINTYSDDSAFTINLLDNIDGGCGLPSGEALELKLTKL